MRKAVIAAALAALSLAVSVRPAAATSVAVPTAGAPKPGWAVQIDRVVRGLPVGVSVRDEGQDLYARAAGRRRTPASNEKVLLSMALLEALGPDAVLVTQAAAVAPPTTGILAGDLWILGSGDPDIRESTMRLLAQRIRTAGVSRVEGSVLGSTGFFKRDWFAPGWKRDFPRSQVALPTALTFEGNQAGGVHVRDPELRAARALRRELRDLGVSVAGPAGAGKAPPGLLPVAEITSDPLSEVLDTMNRFSSNFWAEVLVKRLGAEAAGLPGSIAKGASAIRGFAAGRGIELSAWDGSGLSYANRVSPRGLTRLLEAAEGEPWGDALREALPEAGQGTLGGRLRHISVHAKTGTLTSISALSGYVWLRRTGSWASFSILTRGMSKDLAVRVEDRIVRILARRAA
ncbi:MAG TPA: D-alanyl-D-alanine carboxypeptidase [Actinomycetota bacterium]|nr:D-alanyl-D-alanine carboxypeptidase [Actinomycetota bacterium]